MCHEILVCSAVVLNIPAILKDGKTDSSIKIRRTEYLSRILK
jgi:hypothetical protein